MREMHAFGVFTPPNAKYLILGSFTGKEALKGTPSTDESYDWFYGTQRNQFWPIIEEIYGIELRNRQSKQSFFKERGIAIADIIYQCERKDNSNLDANLINIVYNIKAIEEIIDHHPIAKIYFTSRFVESRFKQNFKAVIHRHPAINLIYLPSPSPRNARMRKDQKVMRYRAVLPK